MKTIYRDSFSRHNFSKKEISLAGVLNPIQWNKYGKVKQYSIYTEDEEDIIVEGFKNKKKLESLKNRRVIAIGTIRVDESGIKYIHLKQIKEEYDPSDSSLGFSNSLRGSKWDEEYMVNIPMSYRSIHHDKLQQILYLAS